MKQDVPTPYLDRKGLAPRRGVFLATDGKTTCIPAVDADGNPTALAAAIPGTDYMPAVPVTASDNGKTLKVVNGVWAASN